MDDNLMSSAQSMMVCNQFSNMSSDNTEILGPRPNRASFRNVLKDIEKAKKRKAKVKQIEEERLAVCLDHLEKGVENLNFNLPFDEPCSFRTQNVGLEGLEAEYNTIMSLRESQSSTKTLTSSQLLNMQAEPENEEPELNNSIFTSIKIGLDGSAKYSRYHTVGKQDEDLHNVYPSGSCLKQDPPLRRPILRFETPDHVQHRVQIQNETIPWFNDRVDVSSLPVRFELPLDVKDLTGMNIRTYLQKFCKISHDRMLVYGRFYKQHKPPKAKVMARSELSRAIHAVLYECVPEEAISQFLTSLNMLRVTDIYIDIKTFAVLAAVAERILYLSYAETAGPVAPGVIRSFTECADFNCLLWKLRDVKIKDCLQTLLFSLG